MGRINKVPIKNIFYMLSYAYDLLPELDVKDFAESDYESSLELFANILCTSTRRILRKGIYREYLQIEEQLKSIKGKVIFRDSLKKNLFSKGQVICAYDDLTYNILHNQVIYTTLQNLLEFKELRKSTVDIIEKTLFKFPQINGVPNIKESLSKIKLHQNNMSYKLPLSICAMIDDLTVLDESNGKRTFIEILRDPEKLHKLFEAFILNFYKRELKGYKAYGSKKLLWQASSENDTHDSLPEMKMDVLLKSDARVIIIDTKFYGQTLSEYYGKKSINSNNLYQIMSYLENYKKKYEKDEDFTTPEGMLLYPTVGEEVELQHKIWGYDIKVQTVDLNLEWKSLYYKILEVVKTELVTDDLFQVS